MASSDSRKQLLQSPAEGALTANKTLSGYQQFRLIMGKNAKLKWRSGADFCCELLAPLILVFALSTLSLTVTTETHDTSAFFTSSVRDASVNSFLSDRINNLNNVYDPGGSGSDEKHHVGLILFATRDSTDDNLKTVARQLCEHTMPSINASIHQWEKDMATYQDLDGLRTPFRVDPWNSCDELVFDTVEKLDEKSLERASAYKPVLGGIVINSFDKTTGVDYTFRFNRSYVQKTSYDVDPFTFYPSSFWLQYTSSGFLMLQKYVDQFFLQELTGEPQQLEPYFQSFPHGDWKFNPFKRNFLAGNFQQFFGYCIIFSLSTLVKGIVDEKKRKIKEGMLMMGLKPWVFWFSWVATYFMIFLFVALSTTAAAYVFVFRNSNFFLVFSFVFLFLMSVVTLALFLSTLFSDPGAASISAIFFYLACIFTPQALIGLTKSARMSFCLLSPMAFYWGFSVFGVYEGANQGVTFDNIHEAQESELNSLMLKDFYLMMAVDSVLYLFLAWYCDKVVPGDFGAKESWYFIVNPFYWCGSSEGNAVSTADADLDDPEAGRRVTARTRGDVEEVSTTLQPRVQIEHLRKVFMSNGIQKVAVNDMNLDVYEDQVTALLGHNGAGKSTTFNMLTGLMLPTSGDATIYGLSVKDQLAQVRLLLGVCPQHDVLWDQLTVMEHLQLFAALKGVPADQINRQALKVISDVGLTEKREQFSCTLSGGMKRKLSIGIAVIGASKVIFLDEPTSGMDPYSRRSTWEVIKKKKMGHVMLFTTHFMDEADLLGDRIAIMSAGCLRCCGSSLFLKKRFGLGYNLTISKEVGTVIDDTPIRRLVAAHCGGDELEPVSDEGASLQYALAFEYLPQFPALFEQLDSRKAELGIDSWGISMTTLEEVFLKLAHQKHVDLQNAEDISHEMRRDTVEAAGHAARRASEHVDPSSPKNAQDKRRTTDMDLGTREIGSFSEHVMALFKKRLKTSVRDKMNWVLQVIVPMMFLLVALIAVTYGISSSANEISLSVDEYTQRNSDNAVSPIPYYYEGADGSKQFSGAAGYVNISKNAKGETFSISDFTIRSDDDSRTQAYPVDAANLEMIDYLYGSDQYSTHYPLFPGFGHESGGNITSGWNHSGVPRVMNLSRGGNVQAMSNYLIGSIDDQQTSRYGAFLFGNDSFSKNASSKSYAILHNGSAYHAMPTFFSLANQQILQAANPSASIRASINPLEMTDREHASNDTIKGLVLCFFLIIAFSIIPSTFVYTLVAEVSSKSKHQQMISGVNSRAYWISAFMWDFLNYLVPAACAIALLYAFDVKAYIGSNLPATLTVFVLYGAASISLTYVMSFGFKDQNNALLACIAVFAVSGFILFFVSWIMSLFSSTQDVDKILRYFYMLSPQYSFAMALYEIFFNDAAKLYPSAFDTECAGKMMIYLAVTTVVYIWLTLLLQHSSTSQAGCLSRFFHRSPEVEPEELKKQDAAVEREIEYCDATFPDENAPALATSPIVVKHLRKVYHGRGNVSAKVAVRDLSFHVPEGEVFGFLGINGAGKTSSLAMLSGEFPPTSGEGYLAGMEMTGNREAINRTMGYCPQFDALFGKLTGREHLQLYARIKGIRHDQEDMVVNHMINTMDLQDHADREAGGYSGGNKRKLSVAIALMGSPRIVFLDEPSTGMDPEARRYMWRVISSTMTGRSVILTTHSMEEAEALSHNIGIMVGGRLRCLGTTQRLKNEYGKGYSMELRTSDAKAESLKRWVAGKFPASSIEEEIGGQLRYEIPQDDVHLSAVFKTLEQDREALGLADFSVSQTTLEQVFVRFAAQQEEETGLSAGQLAAGMRETLPNFVDMCLCKPKTDYEWFVPPRGGNDGPGTRIAIHYNKAACFCCTANPGIVTVADYNLEDIDDETGSYNYSNERTADGSCGMPDITIDETNAPGCPDALCVGCRNGCCGSTQSSCCKSTSHLFEEKGRTFEIIPYNEIPMSNRAHPCFLIVDGKEADTGVDRNVYLEEAFGAAGKKWCFTVALPLFMLVIAATALKNIFVSEVVNMVFGIVVVCFVCGNCLVSSHFKRTTAPAIPEIEIHSPMDGGNRSTGPAPGHTDHNPLGDGQLLK